MACVAAQRTLWFTAPPQGRQPDAANLVVPSAVHRAGIKPGLRLFTFGGERMQTIAKQIIDGLREFNAHLKTGKPITDRFRVTRIVRSDDGTVRTIHKGPK